MCTHPTSPANGLAARLPIRLNPNCYALGNTRLNTRHDSDHASQMKMLKTKLGFSLSSYLHLPRAQALPSGLEILTTRKTDHSSKAHTHSLSLSRQLLQQRAKPNIRHSGRSRSWSRSPCYQATESLHLLLFYSHHLNIVYFLHRQLLLLTKRD
jgi:hypothetical protein